MPSVPQPETVLRARFVIVVVFRTLALIVGVLWAASALQAIIGDLFFGVSPALVRAGLAVRDSPVEEVVLSLVLPAAAVTLAALAPKVALWVVPMPLAGCPFCAHEALPETGSKCTECGRTLPSQLLQQAQND